MSGRGEGGRSNDLFERPTPTVLECATFKASDLALSCPHCLANWSQPTELRPCGNPFLSEHLLLVAYCRSCTAFSVLKGDLTMRKPLQWESSEIARTGYLMSWRARFIAEQSEATKSSPQT